MVWGRWIYAVGGNPEAALAHGHPGQGRAGFATYVISGLCAGIGAVILAGRTDAARPCYGNLLELDTIAAVIIGGASFLGGRGHLGHALIGAVMIGVIRNALNLHNVDIFYQLIAIGAVIVLAVEADVLRSHLEAARRGLQARGRGMTAPRARPVRCGTRTSASAPCRRWQDVSLDVWPRRSAGAAGRQRRRASRRWSNASAGSIALDDGEIAARWRGGRPCARPPPARAAGIETVYQDLALFDNLTPAQNFYAGREVAGPAWLPRPLRFLRQSRDGADRAAEVLDRLQVSLPRPGRPGGDDVGRPASGHRRGPRRGLRPQDRASWTSRPPRLACARRARCCDLIAALRDRGQRA